MTLRHNTVVRRSRYDWLLTACLFALFSQVRRRIRHPGALGIPGVALLATAAGGAGFQHKLKINLSDLTTVLEEIICNVLKRPVLQLAFVTYQNELQYLRQSMEQMQRERNKLRVSVEEANSRAALLAQEVDDNHARLESSLHNKLLLMEKKYQEQARVLMEELQQERESMSSQSNKLKQQLQLDMEAAREEEAKLKTRLHLLQQENIRLEQELHEASEKYLEAQKLNEVLQKELLIVPDLKQRLADLESHANDVQEQSHQNLLQELEKYKKLNQELKDKIDELTLEIENMQQNSASDVTPSKAVNRTHSWLSDYRKTLISGYKRRGSESSSEENSDEESRTIGKLRKTFFRMEHIAMKLTVPRFLMIKRRL
ncbi:Ninein like protein [Argiope bruennichi]|uniref:Ninein like protein n=1 Tax=Argiope bruennichi TaxID=94029 RepID=A0A8T0F4P8_ARGBR|nr:Ninein like protein [Argiope bruennichi]